MHRYSTAITALVAACLGVVPLGSFAAPSGLAWDSVTKISMTADLSSLQPGSFDDDYAAAAAVQAPPAGGGGSIFGQMKQAMAAGQSAAQMIQNGIAQRHFVAGSKERTDDVAAQTATIVDCSARTITTLDLRRKTYRVVSMDQPSTPSSGAAGGPQSGFSDNGTRVALVITNTALGARAIGGQATNGFRSAMTITETNSSGESQTQNVNLLAYYSAFVNPAPNCSRFGASPTASGRGPAMMARYARLMQALASAGTNSRFSLKQSGPPLPLGNLAMYDAATLGVKGQGATFATERGHVRSIDANDPAFSIPSDFTQQQ